jgi:hypothetical protein
MRSQYASEMGSTASGTDDYFNSTLFSCRCKL